MYHSFLVHCFGFNPATDGDLDQVTSLSAPACHMHNEGIALNDIWHLQFGYSVLLSCIFMVMRQEMEMDRFSH